jgi:hypothetical protein
MADDTKSLVEEVDEIVQTILVDNDFTRPDDDFLAGEDYTELNPRFADDVSGLGIALAALAGHHDDVHGAPSQRGRGRLRTHPFNGPTR